MSRKRLELIVVVAVVGLSAAFFASPPEPGEVATPESLGTPRTAAVSGGAVGEPSWGDNPCLVDLHEGQLNLVFKNDGPADYHLYRGQHFQIVLATPKQIVVAADYQSCPLDSVHDCYHYEIFNVPAGRTKMMKLGKAPNSMKTFPAQVPAIYRTYPNSGGRPRAGVADPSVPHAADILVAAMIAVAWDAIDFSGHFVGG
ncbi:MAG: hypothetical protein KF760_04270 [Candidatus Eremiobacteraeota bacterium]|nr:hypothetical protein [Candidatus Eremiobacteraeota bacterium]MCW5867130.1 hypothetical protein [Candidatus Eremiobacteraeota bacterium]